MTLSLRKEFQKCLSLFLPLERGSQAMALRHPVNHHLLLHWSVNQFKMVRVQEVQLVYLDYDCFVPQNCLLLFPRSSLESLPCF